MDTILTSFSCKISSSDPEAPLALKILLDDKVIYENTHVGEPEVFTYDIVEDDQEHELFFVMSGKTHEHTKIDEDGNITKDAFLTINDMTFDEIAMEMIVIKSATYAHDFNGTQAPTVTKFYGEMGCNGTVNLKFSTPIYLWLLENM